VSGPSSPAIPGPDEFTIRFDQIPEGTSLHHIPALAVGAREDLAGRTGEPLFIVRDGRHITVFAAEVPDHENEGSLFWCPNEGVFGSPPNGELYDATGRVIGDTAYRGLIRINSRLGDDELLIDPLTRQPGLAVQRHPSSMPVPADYHGRWNPATETTFCTSPLIGARLGGRSLETTRGPIWPAALAITIGILVLVGGLAWFRRRHRTAR